MKAAKIDLLLPDGRRLGGVEMVRVPCVGEHVLYMDPVAFVVLKGRVLGVRIVAKGGDMPKIAFDAEVSLVEP